MSDLIVIGYPDETTAQNVWDELVKLENDHGGGPGGADLGAASGFDRGPDLSSI